MTKFRSIWLPLTDCYAISMFGVFLIESSLGELIYAALLSMFVSYTYILLTTDVGG